MNWDDMIVTTLAERDEDAEELVYYLPNDTATPGEIDLYENQKEIHAALRDPAVRRVSYMAAEQTGKTTLFTRRIGEIIDVNPHSMGIYFPTEELKEDWIDRKFEPYVRANPRIQEKLPEPGQDGWSRKGMDIRGGGRILLKHVGTANAFSTIDVKTVFCDEVDKWKTPGVRDALSKVDGRVVSFSRFGYAINCASVPAWNGPSYIYSAYQKGSGGEFYTPCHACFQHYVLKFEHINIEKKLVICPFNGCETNDRQRDLMIERGEWRHERDHIKHHRSFVSNQLQCPHVTIADIVERYQAADNVNEWMASAMAIPATVTETKTDLKDEEFKKVYKTVRPFDEVASAYAGVDVQRNRLEYTVMEKKWGGNHMVWIPKHGFVELTAGDDQKCWDNLYEIITSFKPELVYVDAGYKPSTVKERIATLGDERWFPVKGVAPSMNELPVMGKTNTGILKIAVDQVKVDLYGMVEEDSFWVNEDGVPPDYTEQFLSEKLVKETARLRTVEKWVPKPGRRNEAFDCAVYAFAALQHHASIDPTFRRQAEDDNWKWALNTFR